MRVKIAWSMKQMSTNRGPEAKGHEAKVMKRSTNQRSTRQIQIAGKESIGIFSKLHFFRDKAGKD